jgi:hypothetical protein
MFSTNGKASTSSKVYPRLRADAGLARFRYPSDPRDAERFLRKLEQPYQLVVERLASCSHNNPSLTLLLVRRKAR